MSQSEEDKGLAKPHEPKLRPKRPYHKPTVRFERVFEVQALSCGKVQTTQAGCHSNRKAS
jgi:hypothetical protein